MGEAAIAEVLLHSMTQGVTKIQQHPEARIKLILLHNARLDRTASGHDIIDIS